MIFNNADQIYFKFNALDEQRIQITLWDYRHANPIHVGMIMNLEDQDFDAFSLEWTLNSLSIGMANVVLTMSQLN